MVIAQGHCQQEVGPTVTQESAVAKLVKLGYYIC